MNTGPKEIITQAEFEELIAKIPKEPLMASLAKFLEDHGYSPILKNINFAILDLTLNHPSGAGKVVAHGSELLKNIDYSEITFNDCNLKSCNFSGSCFNNCRFNNCNFKNAVFEHCTIKETAFENCRFENTLLMRTHIEANVLFNHCIMKNVDFYKAKFANNVKFRGSSVTDCVFIAAEDEGVIWDETILNDCVLPKDNEFFKEAEKSQSNPPKPVVGILWQPHKPGHAGSKIYEQLIKKGAIPVRISYLHDNEVDLKILDREVKKELNKYEKERSEGKITDKSRAMAMFEASDTFPEEHPEIQKIVERSRVYSEYLDSMMLPGGEDIPSELYGQSPDPRAEPENNYMRSVMELALIRDQQTLGNPIMGICRGCQILNVYHGGDMIQRVDDKGNFMSAPAIKALPGVYGIMPDLMQDTRITGMSVHHQAIQNIGDNLSEGSQLEVVATYNGVVKAAQEKYGAPIMMTQFHPEFYGDPIKEAYKSHQGNIVDKIYAGASAGMLNVALTKNNDNFIATFIDATKHRKEQRKNVVEEIKRVKNNHNVEVDSSDLDRGVVEEHTLSPSKIKGKEGNEKPHITKTTKLNVISSFIQNYRYHQDAKNKKRANRFPVFKKTAFKLINFLDRKIFSRKEEKVIRNLKRDRSELKKLQKESQKNASQIQTTFDNSVEKIAMYYAKNNNTTLGQVSADFLVKEKGFDKISEQRKNYESYNIELEIRRFVDENPQSNLSKAIWMFMKTEGFSKTIQDPVKEKRFPKNEEEMLTVIDWYHRKHSEAVMNTLFKPKDQLLGVKLSDLSKKGSLLTIDEIHMKYSLSIAELMQGGGSYKKYNEALHKFLEQNNGHYPASRQEWRKFQGMIATYSLNDSHTIEFVRKIGAIFQRVEDLEGKIQTEKDPKKISAIQKKMLDTKNQIFALMMEGPQEMPHAIAKYIERHRGLPVDPNSWQQFKDELDFVSAPDSKEFIKKIDKIQAEWKNEVQAKLEKFIFNNPDDKFTKVLIEYKNAVGSLPITQKEWGQFLAKYEELGERMLFDQKATELMYSINQRECLVKEEAKSMKEDTRRSKSITFTSAQSQSSMTTIETKESKANIEPSIQIKKR